MTVRTVDPSKPFDVVIAGAGLAGGTLALRLARAGARVALVDPSRFPRDKLCGEFLSPECWGVFDRLGLSAGVRRLASQAIHTMRITTRRGRAVVADLTGDDGRPGIGVSRSALDDLVIKAAEAAGAEVFEGFRVSAARLEGGSVCGLLARSGVDGPVELRAAVTVAADGRRSPLVQRTGAIRARNRFRPRHFGLKRHLVVDSDSASEPPGTVGLHLVEGGYVGACRVEGGWTNLCGLLPQSTLQKHRGDLDRLAADVFSENPALARLWASARPAGEWKTVADVRVEASRPSTRGIFYAGDAQGTIDPLGGQGMTMALLGAEMLAGYVRRALSNSGGGASEPLQSAYVAEWHRRFDRRVRLCRAFHHVLVSPWLIDGLSLLRSLGPKLLTLGFDRTRDPGDRLA